MIIVPAIVVLIVALVLILGGRGSMDAIAPEAVDAMSAAVDERSTTTHLYALRIIPFRSGTYEQRIWAQTQKVIADPKELRNNSIREICQLLPQWNHFFHCGRFLFAASTPLADKTAVSKWKIFPNCRI